jgi:hypothetical protein
MRAAIGGARCSLRTPEAVARSTQQEHSPITENIPRPRLDLAETIPWNRSRVWSRSVLILVVILLILVVVIVDVRERPGQ